MSTFIGVVFAIIAFCLVCRGIWFVLKIGRHMARDLSSYANEQPYNTPRDRPTTLTGRPAHVKFTDAEKEYFAAHVPESARKRK